MATNLLLSVPSIPFDALVITPSSTVDPDKPLANLINGRRQHFFQFDVASTAEDIEFDLGVGNTQAVDHLIIARADLLQDEGVTTITLDRSTDGIVWVTEQTIASFGSVTLRGPQGHDLILTFATTAAFRYWRITYAAGGATKFPHSKVYFGIGLDLGVDPDTFKPARVPSQGEELSENATIHTKRLNEPVYEFDILWGCVLDSAIITLKDKIALNWNTNAVFLYTSFKHEILDDLRVIHTQVTKDITVEQVFTNINIVNISFRELLG